MPRPAPRSSADTNDNISTSLHSNSADRLFVPTDLMPPALGAVADVLPLTYAVEAMQAVAGDGGSSSGWDAVAGDAWSDLGVVLGFAVAALGLGAATLRRRTA